MDCFRCGRTLDKTSANFRYRVAEGSTPSWERTCRDCRLLQRKKAKLKAADKREVALRKMESSGVDALVATALAGGSNIPHSAEVLEMVMQYFGGVCGFSGLVVKQYFDSPPGGSARNRLIETIVRLVSKNVEQGGAKKPLTLWSEDELEGELTARFEEAVKSYNGVTINGKAHKTAQKAITSIEPADGSLLDAIRARQVEESPDGDSGAEDRGSAALQADAPAGTDPLMFSE